MKKLFPVIVVVLLVVLGAAVYLYSERLLHPETAPVAAAPSGGTPAGDAVPTATNDGAHKVSLFWRDASTGSNEVWRFGAEPAPERFPAQKFDAGWRARVFAPGGWDGDDLVVWRNDTVGQLRLWRLARDGKLVASEVLPYSGEEWRIVAAADMDGDGDADLAWVGPNGSVAVWTLQDGKPVDKQTVGTARAGWQLIQSGDFDGDRIAELLWRDPATGRMVLWVMNGTAKATERGLPGVPTEWTLIGAAQLDGKDGDDLLWRNTSGRLAIWHGLAATGAVLIHRSEVADWAFAGLADFNGDGRADLIWRHRDNGSLGAWSIDDEGKVQDLKLPVSPAGAELVSTGFVAP